MDMNLAGSMTRVLAVEDTSQVGHARRMAQQLAETERFDETDAGRVALAATELATNLLKHAGRGELHLRRVPGQGGVGIELLAIDRGAGFTLAQCMPDGFSTAGTQGNGLGALRRQAEVFDAYSDARGSALLAQLFPRGVGQPACRYGVSQHSLRNDPACGDAWHLAYDQGRVSALVIDGLGHGEFAQEAARAGAAPFAEDPFRDAPLLISEMHGAMSGTRGGAAAVAQFDPAGGRLRFTGIGNIGANLVGPDRSRGLASHPGIVGVQFRKAHAFDFDEAAGRLLVMYSDGLQSRWNLADYPGLINRHPALIAAVLHRDFCRGRDDVTVLVVALEKNRG
jgi:anti-sigma regulatory factor (Ser/Thr protein kinase)